VNSNVRPQQQTVPYYSVKLHGSGIRLPTPAGTCTGFYTTRAVRASSETEAAIQAKERVLAEWANPPYSKANLGALPSLTAESIARTSFVRALKVPRKGYTFYESE